MFNWSPENLPDGSFFFNVQTNVDQIIQDAITREIKEHIESKEIEFLKNFINLLFNEQFYKITKEVDEMEAVFIGDSYKNLPFVQTDLKTNTAPYQVLLSVFSFIFLSFNEYHMLENAIVQYRKISLYKQNKVKYARERAETLLNKITVEFLIEQMKRSFLKNIQLSVNHFFNQILPARLESAKSLVKNLEQDITKPIEVRRHCHYVESLVKPIYGQILFVYMDVFGEGMIDPNDLTDIKEQGKGLTATINLGSFSVTCAFKKVPIDDNSSIGWSYLADITSFR